jgi:hypothetical protein
MGSGSGRPGGSAIFGSTMGAGGAFGGRAPAAADGTPGGLISSTGLSVAPPVSSAFADAGGTAGGSAGGASGGGVFVSGNIGGGTLSGCLG